MGAGGGGGEGGAEGGRSFTFIHLQNIVHVLDYCKLKDNYATAALTYRQHAFREMIIRILIHSGVT